MRYGSFTLGAATATTRTAATGMKSVFFKIPSVYIEFYKIAPSSIETRKINRYLYIHISINFQNQFN